MPELPEVETIMRAVEAAMKDAVIERVTVRQPRLRQTIPADFSKRISGARIRAFGRKAKYMLMHLDNNLTVIWHFGMSGKIKIESAQTPYEPQKHDHVILETSNGRLIYNDPRRFGLIVLCNTANWRENPLFANLGPDPWDESFSPEYLAGKLAHKKTAIKIALMDQNIVCGIGNIYASEILYLARIRPDRTAESISADEIKRLIKYTRQVLQQAINAGGSSIHDYVHPDGDIGYFQESHCVYNKIGLRCPQCRCNPAKTGGIQKIVLGGRSTFYCDTLQK